MPTRRRIALTQWGHQGYVHVIEQGGGDVIVVTEKTLMSDLNRCHGIVIPGGVDVCPGWYKQPMHYRTQKPQLERDAMEMALLMHALEKDMPILGVCRGHQLLNVTLGGTLIQDMVVQHNGRHPVRISQKSKHLDFIGEKNGFLVNSYHHQAVDKLGNGLKAIAWAKDGTVEAIESTEHSFVVGVQWHPEMSLNEEFRDEMRILLTRFCHAA